ncbi:MAG: DEAD/DEAH box helicase [Acidimicrobiales bacterium]
MPAVPDLIRLLPADPSPDNLLDAFLAYLVERGVEPYPAQEEAIIEIFSGNHVVLNTPTGSGKSLVAVAAHFAALAWAGRSFYTAPIKALVSEKFFALCREFGSERVGMITGDASVNPTAPIICCTAEILANMALRDGSRAEVDVVIMDEFHYYAERDRGWAWQTPLLQLPHATFLLMSATLGDTSRFEEDLARRTGKAAVLVKSADRPVPLEYEYRETTLLESIQHLLDVGKAPVYLVHFTQNAAVEQAQNLMSVDFLSKDDKAQIRSELGAFRFDSPFGADLKRFVQHGIGVHHAGLLPKYRLLVEKLAQAGRLKIICGTDTLGVGVNVPIRTVLFTQLCKYDGARTRLLSVREFQQIAGRAGRKGFDTRGYVWAQAPAHVVENKIAEAKAANDPAKRRKLVKRKPPERGFVPWNADTLRKLSEGEPETLTSSFAVSHAMLLNLLDRPPRQDSTGGCAAVKEILLDNHEARPAQRRHIRRAIRIYRSLREAGVVEELDAPDEFGRRVRVDLELQDDFRLNQPLSPFVLAAVGLLEAGDDPAQHALDVVSIVESVLENPLPVLLRQRELARNELYARLKSERVEYEELQEQLSQVEWPKPLAEFIYGAFNRWAARHPWVGQENVAPKSVARELYERAMTFREYVNAYGLKRAEGVLLRYLADAYKGLVQTVPESAKTEELYDLTEWLGETVRLVDSSLLDEWERLRHPDDEAASERAQGVAAGTSAEGPPDVTANRRAFRVMVRNECWAWVQALARRDYARLAQAPAPPGQHSWTSERVAEAMAGYWAEHPDIQTGAEARGPAQFQLDEAPGPRWPVRQNLLDPQGWGEWRLLGWVDLERSREEARAVVALAEIGR